MKRTIFKTLIKSKANAEKDIDLINQFSKKQLQPDEVFFASENSSLLQIFFPMQGWGIFM